MIELHPDLNELQEYDPSIGITIPVVLTAAGKSYKTLAKLDSGTSHCIFRREHGEALGLTIDGLKERFATPTGTFTAYAPEVELFAIGTEFLTTVYFAASPAFLVMFLAEEDGWTE